MTAAQMSYLATAGELVAARRFDEAEGEILRALTAAPDDVQALNLLALVRYKLGRLDDAQTTYREVTLAAPNDAAARRNLGLISLKLGQLDEALPELEMAVRLAPGDQRAWSYLGYGYAKKGDVVEAAAAFRRAGQDALATELEQAAQLRRPATPAVRDAIQTPQVQAYTPEPEEQGGATEDAGPDFASLVVPVKDAVSGPLALAPPLPSPEMAAARPAAGQRASAGGGEGERAQGEHAAGSEVAPIPLLNYVLSRLGQGAPARAPRGALRLAVKDGAFVRADAMLVGAGPVAWEAAFRRAQGRRKPVALGADGRHRFFRLAGGGEVWIAGVPGRWLPLALSDDVVYIREERVLAFDGSLAWEAGTIPGAELPMLQFRGRGTIAVELDEASIAVKVTEEHPTLIAGAHLVGWVGRLVPHGERLADDGPFQVSCQGEGVVLLDTGRG